MIKIVAPTLEEAYKKASQAYDSSIVDLDIEVIQTPSRGIFGLFKKEAVINVRHKNEKENYHPYQRREKREPSSALESDKEEIRKEIEEGLKRLIESSCFDAEVKSVTIDENSVVHLELDGADAALMIGKEGYRYKALSYMLHNWIKMKYHLMSTLEIASFLKTQKESIERYLDIFSEKVAEGGRVQTKPLDGILVKLALESLRERYPDKYVAIRTLKNGKKVIVVNDYHKNAE
jgi:spoIIIJ-associated protein